jgi:microsomal dipeptidase-like Zn-dependent dipeptidase
MNSTFSLFDLHCDTAFEMFARSLPFGDGRLCINAGEAAKFGLYSQVFALWSDVKLSEEEAWRDFWRMLPTYDSIEFPNLRKFLAVEGGHLLGGELSRLRLLAAVGVRILTPVWGGTARIGGAHDTDIGLSEFGEAVVRECFRLHIIPDVSHGSVRLTDDVLRLASECGNPVIASHSCSFAVNPHTRNLCDRQFEAIARSGGIVGLCMAGAHIGGTRDVAEVLRHIDHFLSIGDFASRTLCLGCDFDGAADYPRGIEKLGGLYSLAEAMSKIGYAEPLIRGILCGNAHRFFCLNVAQTVSVSELA